MIDGCSSPAAVFTARLSQSVALLHWGNRTGRVFPTIGRLSCGLEKKFDFRLEHRLNLLALTRTCDAPPCTVCTSSAPRRGDA
jgi:hypothetical protein